MIFCMFPFNLMFEPCFAHPFSYAFDSTVAHVTFGACMVFDVNASVVLHIVYRMLVYCLFNVHSDRYLERLASASIQA